jgi:AcrR family transcriptional regulator
MARAKRARTYDAAGRQKRALDNQERVLEVARELFATRGYVETTLDEIASAAGIAVPTVYAMFQSKRGLLSALLKRLIAGVAGGPPLVETEGPRAVNAEPDPRRALTLFVDHLLGVQERAIPMYEVMKHAARAEADIAELLVRMQQYRYSNLETLALHLGELGALRTPVEDASRTLWAITSPEVRQMLLAQAGWSIDRYRDWLEDTLVAVLLKPKKNRRS